MILVLDHMGLKNNKPGHQDTGEGLGGFESWTGHPTRPSSRVWMDHRVLRKYFSEEDGMTCVLWLVVLTILAAILELVFAHSVNMEPSCHGPSYVPRTPYAVMELRSLSGIWSIMERLKLTHSKV